MADSNNGSTPPPNWYPDPEKPGYLRYFDGKEWTEHRHKLDVQADSSSEEKSHSSQKKKSAAPLIAGIVGTIAIILVAAVVLFTQTGKQKGSVAGPGSDNAQSVRQDDAPGKETEDIPGNDVIYLPKGNYFQWRGGMVASVRFEDDITEVTSWMPGMESAKICDLELLKSNETFAWGNDDSFDIGSTLDLSDQTAFLIFALTDNADRLNKSVNVYIQTLDVQSCKLGDKRLSITEPVAPSELGSTSARLVGASDSVLAIRPFDKGGKTLGFDTKKEAIVWELAGDVRNRYNGESDFNPAAPSLFVSRDVENRRDQIISVQDGSVLVSTDYAFELPTSIGTEGFLYEEGDSKYNLYNLKDGRSKLLSSSLSGKLWAGLYDEGTPLVVARARTNDSYTDGLVAVSNQGEIGTILTDVQMKDADASLVGFISDQVILNSENELLLVDLSGKQIGELSDPYEYPYSPANNFISGNQIWTLWLNNYDSWDGVITKNGVIPSLNND